VGALPRRAWVVKSGRVSVETEHRAHARWRAPAP
jgi:hypothetical protein